MMTDPSRRHPWSHKFRWAVRGIGVAVGDENNFRVHGSIALAVVVTAAVLRLGPLEWCLLVLCMALVLSAEMLNTAIERLARAITSQPDDSIRDALDVAAGGVLLASAGAAVTGAILFGYRLGTLVGWW